MTAADAFKLWRPDTLVPSHEEAFEAGWKACMAHVDPKAYTPVNVREIQSAIEAAFGEPAPAYKTVTAEISQPTAEDIYNAYPRKVGKQAALKAIKKADSQVNLGSSPIGAMQYLYKRTQAYAAAVAKWPSEDRQFVPHPATWFNRGSYDDDPAEWQRGISTSQQIKTRN